MIQIEQNNSAKQDEKLISSTTTNNNRDDEDDVFVEDDFAVFDSEFNPMRKQQQKQENEDDDGVLSFEVPDVVKISTGGEGDGTVSKVGKFKFHTGAAGGSRPEFGIEKTSQQNQNQHNPSSTFASELAEKLFSQQHENQRQHINIPSTNSLNFQNNNNNNNKLKQQNNNNQFFMMEQLDGSLSNVPLEKVQKSAAQEKFERKQQRRFELLQESQIWAKYQPRIDKGDALATAQALKEIDQVKNQSSSLLLSSSSSKKNSPARNMTRKELAAYRRHCGGTTVTGDALVEHTRRQMALGEQRSVKSLRKAKELEYTHSSRMKLNSQPGGLWSQYASANEGGVNSNNVDLEKDESMKRERRVLGW